MRGVPALHFGETNEVMHSVFVVQHLHILPGGEEDVKFVGVYRSFEAACSAVERLRSQPGFRDHPRIGTIG
jgi:homoserine kinase type II